MRPVFTLDVYECNSSSPLTFAEIRLHAIVILLQYLLVIIFACSTIFPRTASNKVNVRGTERNYVNKKLFFSFLSKRSR